MSHLHHVPAGCDQDRSRRAVVSYWRKYVYEVLVNRLGGLRLPRKSVVRLTDRPDMTLDVYRGRETTNQQINNQDRYVKSCPTLKMKSTMFSLVYYLQNLDTNYSFLYLLSLIIYERIGKK